MYKRTENIVRTSRLSPFSINLVTFFWMVKKRMAKQKKPTIETIKNSSGSFGVEVVAAHKNVVKAYLDEVNLENWIDGTPNSSHYIKVRELLMESLDYKSKENPIFAALIERIARTSLILQKLDYLIAKDPGAVVKDRLTFMGKSYLGFQQEHRKCIESFANIKFAFERNKKSSAMKDIMAAIQEETDDTDTKETGDIPQPSPKGQSI